jgi:hypothetical protein
MKSIYVLAAILISLLCFSRTQAQTTEQKQTDWIARVIKETGTIKKGMTRADLLKVFVEEGGLSTASRRTYAYRDCPYIKVDVEFDPVEKKAKTRGLTENAKDVISKISKPYLDWSVMD